MDREVHLQLGQVLLDDYVPGLVSVLQNIKRASRRFCCQFITVVAARYDLSSGTTTKNHDKQTVPSPEPEPQTFSLKSNLRVFVCRGAHPPVRTRPHVRVLDPRRPRSGPSHAPEHATVQQSANQHAACHTVRGADVLVRESAAGLQVDGGRRGK